MAEQENFTPEQAQKLLEEVYDTKTPSTATIVTQPATAVNAEPVAPTPVVEGVTPVTPPEPTTPEKPSKEEKPATAPVVSAPPAALEATDPYAWVEHLTPEMKEKVLSEIHLRMNAEHAFRSNNGRIRALQEKLRDAENKASRPQAPAAKPEPTPPSTPEGWDALKKTDPDLAQALEARVKSEVDAATARTEQKLQELRDTEVVPLQQRERREYVNREHDQLRRLIPNVDQIVQSPHYAHWLENEAPPAIRDTALKSVDHRDAYAVMQHYAGWLVATGQAKAPERQPSTPSTPTNQPPAAVAEVTPPAKTPEQVEADRIAAERDARLRAPSTVPAAQVTPSGPGDPKGPVTKEMQERLFEEAWAKLHPKKT